MKKTIAIDIDDVLADNASGFVAFSNKIWGTNLKPEDYDEHWAKVWSVDIHEVEKRATEFHASNVFQTYAPIDSAVAVLNRLRIDFNLIIVTSRRLQVRKDTIEWVHIHYPGIFSDDVVHFAGIWDTIDDQSIHRTKADVVESLEADYLIDDQLKHCLAVAESGRTALLFGDYSWNQMPQLPSGVVRAANWQAIEEYFYGE
jgi:5'(3')-deoxyribonucleotidase